MLSKIWYCEVCDREYCLAGKTEHLKTVKHNKNFLNRPLDNIIENHSKQLKNWLLRIYLKKCVQRHLKKKYITYIHIYMNKRDLKNLTKAQLIRLLLKQEKYRQAQKPSNSVKQMVSEYEDIIQPKDNSEMHTGQFHHREMEN